MDRPQLSVIVPSRDRPGLLRGCLAGLDDARLEVIVVDDGSRVPLAEVAEAAGARCVRLEPRGLNAARNAGVDAARAPLVAFLDDDVEVARDWAEAMLDAFDTAGADVVGGRVRLALAGPAPRWMSALTRDYLSEYERGDDPFWIDDKRVPFGANCALRRDLCLQLGGFRAGLDRDGPGLLSGGETELFRRAQQAGARIYYAPRAAVAHRIGAERLTVDYMQRRAFAQGQSDRQLEGPFLRSPLRGLGPLGTGLLSGRGTVPARLWWAYRRGRGGG